MSKPIASLSLDLDNKWAYMRTHGLAGWDEYPSYLPMVCDRVSRYLSSAGLRATVFVVGKDLESEENRDAISSLAGDGHEIGNHSYWHFPWLDRLDRDVLEQEIADTETLLEAITGERPFGFRAPGFSGSPVVQDLLAARGYRYDASAFPTLIGPLAAWYARVKSFGSKRDDGQQHFATLRDGLGPLRPYPISVSSGQLVEVPVTTMPLLRVPIHVTYLMYLQQFSGRLAKQYLRWAIRLCRLRGVGPSMLLHPLDFLGGEEEPDLAFFPGMKVQLKDKLALLDQLANIMSEHFSVGTVDRHAMTVLREQATPTSDAISSAV